MKPITTQTMHGLPGENRDETFSIALNEVLQVRIPDDPNAKNHYSKVLGVSNGIIVIPWPTHRGIRLVTHPGRILDFYFIRRGMPHYFSGMVDKTDAAPMPQMTIVIKTPAQHVQRRQARRVKCVLPMEVAGTIREGPGDKASSVLMLRTVCSDLSASGISFCHARQIPEGVPVNLALSLPDHGPVIKIPCSVVYSEYLSEHQAFCRTALRYIALTEGDRSRIVRYIDRSLLEDLKN